jgi:predicted helicase
VTFEDLLTQFSSYARTNRDKGTLFERLIQKFLLTDPQYATRLSNVWLWPEWPGRWTPHDTGIDLIARERATGDYWAVQCKFFDSTHTVQKADIDSFFTTSGKHFQTEEGERGFSYRLIVSTTDRWSKHAEEALVDQTIPVMRLWVKDLAESPIDWGVFSLENLETLQLRKRKVLRPHQEEAVKAVLTGLGNAERGKLIMACGTGKTLTSLRLAERIVPQGGRILFLAPSISLVAQTLREWTGEAEEPVHAFAVCSDSKVGRDEEDISTRDLAYPATTDPDRLASHMAMVSPDRRTVVFSTYQSIQVIADAQNMGLPEFDLIICDEGHRTTGLTLPGEDPSEFVKVHDNIIVRGRKRVYMTATPRIFGEASKTKASRHEAVLYSMDDEETYGSEFYRLGFDKAASLGLLAEYKVLIVAVREAEMAALANNFNKAFKVNNKKAINVAFATKIIGSWKGLSKRGLVLIGEDGEEEAKDDLQPMRRAIAFSRSIKDSQLVTEIFTSLVERYQEGHLDSADQSDMVSVRLQHVDGTMNALQRQEALGWLKGGPEDGECRILSNARCLSEGIDVPALDAVVFFDTRDSIVDIVQSVGRVMRMAPGKQYGYIVLPVCIPSEKVTNYNDYIENDPQFKGIWQVIKALRAHDERLVDEAEFRRRITVISDPGRKKEGWETSEQGELPLEIPFLPIEAINEAVYAAIPKKLGDREYWADWAKDIARVANTLTARITTLIQASPVVAEELARFLKGLQETLNPAVTREEAIEMLVQHILTLPVFQALFAETNFPENNAVGKALQRMVEKLDAAAVASETEGLEKFYQNVRERISLARSDKSKQEIIRNLYDTFFNTAFPKMSERLGIVYTPIEVVDYILKSADAALRKHFGESLGSPGVQILDPFAGTGTFFVRLLQLGLIPRDKLPEKYLTEIHANEIVLLAYYIATVNIETAYHGATGEYLPFEGMVLTDTFQMTEKGDLIDRIILPENNARVERQLAQPIRVIVGNPPYSAQQESQNDNNRNLSYPELDTRIRETYAAQSNAKLLKNLYDSYIRAIRWASDRIGERGVVAFVTNGSFLDARNMDGLRKCLVEEHSQLYVFNLRGNQRTSGEESKREGSKIFGSGSRTPVVITIMVKDPRHQGPGELYYHDIGDYLTQEEKLTLIGRFASIDAIPWQRLQPNAEADWINQRDPEFETFIPLGNKEDEEAKTIFGVYSLGVSTGRDAWAYNMGRQALEANMRRMIGVYNEEQERYARACESKPREQWPSVEEVIDSDPKRISWTVNLKEDLKRSKKYKFEETSIVTGMYRPFVKQWLYFNRSFIERILKQPKLFPTPRHHNIVISVTGVGAARPFSALVSDCVPNLHLHDTGQCFPLYWYDKIDNTSSPQQEILADSAPPDTNGYIRREAITDWALEEFRKHYADGTITKEDIFWYVYGILHSPDYRSRFAANLKKMLPRVPFATDFWAFSRAGKDLGHLHLNYETVEPYPLTEEARILELEPWQFYRVRKIAFGKGADGKVDKTVIVYNQNLTLRDIPLAAYQYVVNGKSAIEWAMERYSISEDKDSGIVSDPNEWCREAGNPRYIVDLIRRLVTVSLRTEAIVKGLPPLS